jgi:glycolate oxidase
MKKYNRCTDQDIQYLKSIIGDESVITDKSVMKKYTKDMTEDFVFFPECIVKPHDTQHISKILKYCNEKNIPVTPQGRHTGLSGGALPVAGGLALSMENFDKILEIDEKNYTVTVEPYVISHILRQTVEEKNLFYPPDPASLRICSIGGNIAEASGGPKCIKYGTTKDYVLNLEVVLPNGEIMWTGRNVIKNVTGYNLTQLIVGSEGTLGIVTKIILKLLPKPHFHKIMIASFSNMKDSSEAVNTILGHGLIPSCMEFMERNALLASREFTKVQKPEIRDTTQAHLIIEFEGDEHSVLADLEKTKNLLEKSFSSIEYILFANTLEEEDGIWKLRRAALAAAKSLSHCKEEDLVVPRYLLPQVVETLEQFKEKYKLDFIAWGHAGDGNLHVCLLQMDYERQKFEDICNEYLTEFFHIICNQLGGTVTGEHGVGYIQRRFMAENLDPVALKMMRAIKDLFDPKGILNPQKIFLD